MIETLNTLSEYWLSWQMAMLWQTAVLITIVWAVDLLIRKWAWPQVRYALWMLVLVKLLIPPTFTSPASITSHIPATAQKVVQSQLAPEQSVTPASSPQFDTFRTEPPVTVTSTPTETATEMERIDSAEQTASPAPPTTPAIHPSWKTCAMFTWLLGIAVLSLWLFRRLSGLRKEHLKSGEHFQLPPRFNEQLTVAADRLKLKRLPQVILTDRVSCPAVFGIFHPVLLMPAEKFKHMSKPETEHILLHELAHIKRGDLLVHGLYMTLQIVYWFNPLLWAIRRTLQNLRELCCDATVARLLKEDTVGYRQTLLETARRLLAEPVDPGLGLLGLFENSNWLVARLHWLEKKTWKNRPLRIATIITLVAVMAACVLPMGNRPKPQYSVTLDNGVTVELVAVCNYPGDDKSWWTPDGGPCPFAITAEDHSGYTSEDPGYEFVFRKTGPLPFKVESVKGSNANSGLTVLQPEGLTGRRVHIKSRYQKTDIKIASPSGSWKTVLTSKPGQGSASATISGKTLVLAGLVAAGPDVIVSCSDELGYKQASRMIVIGTDGTEHTGTVQTDAGINNIRQRTLRFDGLGIDDVAEVRFQTCPYQYYTFKNVALRPDSEGPYKVAGTVTDVATGAPLAGAEVYDDGYNNSKYRTTTDENGRFTLKTANEEHNISAKAEGYKIRTNVLKTFPFANHENFNFELTPETKAEPSASSFTATLDSGTTAQLVCISFYPIGGKPGWTAAGDLLETPIESAPNPVSVYPITDDEQARLFTLMFDGAGADDVRFRPQLPQAGYMFWVNAKKQIVAKFPASKQSCDLTLEVAAGPWKTVAFGGDGKTNAYTNDAMTDSSVIFYPAENENGQTVIRIANQLGKIADCRSVIYDKSKQLYEPLTVSNTGSDIASCECRFDLPIDQIAYIVLQARPFETVTFKNVALRPDLKTLVETEVQAPDDSGQESEEKARTADIWKSIDKEGAEKLMNEYIKALVENNTDGIRKITAAATPETQQLRLSLNEAEKLVDARVGASSYVKSEHTVLLVSGGSIKRIDGLEYSLRAVTTLEDEGWVLNDARWYRTYDMQTPFAVLKKVANGEKSGLDKIVASMAVDTLEKTTSQLFEKLTPALEASGDLYTGPVFDGNKVSIAREDIVPVAIEFVDALRNNDKSRMDALTPSSLREKLYRLPKICRIEGIGIDEIYANESFAIIVTDGVRRHDGQPHQLGVSFAVYPGGKWVFTDLDWLSPDTRQIYVDSFKKNFPDAKALALRPGGKMDTEVPLDKLVKSVSFENVPLRDALEMLGDMYKVNIIPSQAVAQDRTPVPVTNLYNVTFEEILNALCDTTHTWQKKDNVIYVYTDAEYKAPRPDDKTDSEK